MKKQNIDIAKLEILIDKIMSENHIMGELYDYDSHKMSYKIIWGDWKHSHLRFEWVVGELLNKMGIKYQFSSYVTEEDGSDCYSGVHVIHFL